MGAPSPLGPTKARIVEYLAFDRKTAKDLASHLRIQVSAVRKHLERLRGLGIVEEWFVRAGRGRPKKMYGLSALGRELLPRRYDMILNEVLAVLVRERGADQAESVMNRVAGDLVDRLGRASKGSRRELERFVAGLSELGFEASLTTRDGGAVITSANCPILAVASAQREVACRGLHGELIRLGTGAREVRRERWIVEGAPVCSHAFSKPGDRGSSGHRRKGRTGGSGPAGTSVLGR